MRACRSLILNKKKFQLNPVDNGCQHGSAKSLIGWEGEILISDWFTGLQEDPSIQSKTSPTLWLCSFQAIGVCPYPSDLKIVAEFFVRQKLGVRLLCRTCGAPPLPQFTPSKQFTPWKQHSRQGVLHPSTIQLIAMYSFGTDGDTS